MLFGWRPYIIESGSMEPRIKVGDVVLASPRAGSAEAARPRHDVRRPGPPGQGQDPPRDQINDDGTLQTKGDANQTPDSVAVSRRQVRGHRPAARALGGPAADLVHHGCSGSSSPLFVLSLLLACLAVANDQEDEEEDEDDTDPDPPDLELIPGADAAERVGAALRLRSRRPSRSISRASSSAGP